jgi:RNA polymerase sigma factor (sigma-70 family)
VATAVVQSTDLAFERLYEEYARIVYRYALAVLRNPADAEDITQTTFLNAYRAMKGGEVPLQPRHWLLKIAHNSCRMRWVRNSRRPQEVEFDDKVERIAAPESERPNLRAVLDELAKLPFNQRSALVMRELEGRSYEEIAETLDVTVPAVETLLVRARRSMRLKKSAINALGAVQLPASLETFLGGGAAVATGGALVGGGVAFKAAAVLVAGLVAGGAGYTAVGATKKSRPDRSEPRAVAAAVHVQRGSVRTLAAAAKPHRAAHVSATKPAKPATAVPAQQHDPASPQAPAGPATAPAPAAPADSPAAASPSAPATTTSVVPVSTPVQPPQLPVQPPQLPVPAPPALPAPPPLPVQPPAPPPVPTVTPVVPHLP